MGHEVQILYLPHFLFSTPDLHAMRRAWGTDLHVAPGQWNILPPPIAKRLLEWRERHLPHQFLSHRTDETDYDRFALPKWGRLLRSLSERERFDVVIAEYVILSRLLNDLPHDVLTLIDTHDSLGQRNDMLAGIPDKLRWLTTSADDEGRGLARAGRIIAIQEDEAAYFRSITTRPVITVGHLLADLVSAAEPDGPPSLLIVASSNPINGKAVMEFLDRTWPLLRRQVPDARLRLFGRICGVVPDSIPGVEKCGIVEDTRTVYERGHVVVNPQIEATGLAIKSIEALGFGKALVTTPVGARGLSDGRDRAFRVAETPEETAAVLAGLLRDESKRHALAADALRYAKDWQQRQIESLRSALEPLDPEPVTRSATPSI